MGNRSARGKEAFAGTSNPLDSALSEHCKGQRKIERGILIDQRLSRQELAAMTGATLYSVSRVISWMLNALDRADSAHVAAVFGYHLAQARLLRTQGDL